MYFVGGFLGRGLWGTGDFAPCEARPETLSLDSAAFEKAGETFILRYAPYSTRVSLFHQGSVWDRGDGWFLCVKPLGTGAAAFPLPNLRRFFCGKCQLTGCVGGCTICMFAPGRPSLYLVSDVPANHYLLCPRRAGHTGEVPTPARFELRLNFYFH